MLRLLAQGCQLREIAQQLEISPRTVEVYKARMMEKLGCRTLADVVRALNTLGATPQDLLAILQAIKAAGALNAELEVI